MHACVRSCHLRCDLQGVCISVSRVLYCLAARAHPDASRTCSREPTSAAAYVLHTHSRSPCSVLYLCKPCCCCWGGGGGGGYEICGPVCKSSNWHPWHLELRSSSPVQIVKDSFLAVLALSAAAAGCAGTLSRCARMFSTNDPDRSS